jgi:hypothetical protein
VRKHFPAFAVFALFTFALHALWFGRGTTYPIGDAAAYALQPVRIYHAFVDDGPSAALEVFYRDRGWKPIVHQYLILPFLAVTGGDLRAALRLYSPLAGLAFALAIYAFLLRLGGTRTQSGACTLALLSTAWGILDQGEFLSEIPFLVCALMALREWPRETGEAHWTKTAVWLTVALLVRPVEAAITVLPAFLADYIRRFPAPQRLRLAGRMAAEGFAALTLALYPFFVYDLGREYSALQVTIFTVGIVLYWIYRWRRRPDAGFLWTTIL